MIVLRSRALLLRADPRHGGEVLDLVDLRTGRQLLGRPPFGSALPRAGDLDEATWTDSYRGGWQPLLPNFGTACVVDGEHHGFHGRASVDPWEVADARSEAATLRWSGHGLAAERQLRLEGGALQVRTTVQATAEQAPLVAAEHLAFGLELLEPAVELELPPATAHELDEAEGPARPPAGAAAWPLVTLRGGATERGERWPLATARSRLYALSDVPEGRAVLRNAARGQAVEVTWDTPVLRHLVVWHEARGYGGPWRGATELLCLEPCTVPHLLGLRAALEHGQAELLECGEGRTWTVAVRPYAA